MFLKGILFSVIQYVETRHALSLQTCLVSTIYKHTLSLRVHYNAMFKQIQKIEPGGGGPEQMQVVNVIRTETLRSLISS